MDTQKLPEQIQNVQGRRRFIKKVGVAAPVVLTLSSPSVLGVGCLSQQLSGNASHPHDSCVLGHNPDFWQNPLNISVWSAAGYEYGTSNGNPGSCSGYKDGTPFNAVFGGTNSTPMRKVLCDDATTLDSYFIAAMLNAKTVPDYVMTTTQVSGLYIGTVSIPPGYPDTKSFLASTWS